MEYEKLLYTNQRGEQLELSNTSVFHVNVSKDVTGLSEIDNNIYTSDSIGQHGSTYIGQKIESKKIKIKGHIKIIDKAQAISLRRKALRILNPELQGNLKYIYNGNIKEINCNVSDNVSFYKGTIYLSFEIVLIALHPFWSDIMEKREEIAKWEGDWTFPTIIDYEDGMIYGHRTENIIVNVCNVGDITTGMRIRFTSIGTVTNPKLLNINTNEYIQINTKMLPGDIIDINTEYGQKTIVLTRNGIQEDYFRNIDVDSVFMQLCIGDNIFKYDAESGSDLLEVTIYYNPQYLGV